MTTPPTVPSASVPDADGRVGGPPSPRLPAQVDAAAERPEAPAGWTKRPVVPPAVVGLVGWAAGFLILGGLYLTAWLVGPAFLALIIVIAISPVQTWLLGRGWPSWLTTLTLVVSGVSLLLLFAGGIVVSIAHPAAPLPQYAGRSAQLMQSLSGSLQRFGVEPGQLKQAV